MYEHFGVMLDCSRNAVMQPQQVKRFIDCLEKMGYNTLEIYAEDTYRIPGEPWFGYLRGGYTPRELKDLDAYARAHGVELIPCVQALAHFTNLVKLPQYADIVDTADILLVGEEKTYELIEKIIANAAESFTSRNLNIGFDEAHMVGLGRYLEKHGYEERFGILLTHLRRVVDIAARYGFKVHMWSDMFFRLQNGGAYCGRDIHIDPAVRAQVPEEAALVYWDYWTTDLALCSSMFASHQEFGRPFWFAGGAESWNGFAPFNAYACRAMKNAMQCVREYQVRNVLMTMWGDDGKECSYFALLPALYAVRQYADGNFDDMAIARGFEELFGCTWDDFMLLDIPNHTSVATQQHDMENACKSLLYNDYFLGILDPALQQEGHIPYDEFAQKLHEAAPRMGQWSYISECLAALCDVLAVKAELGLKTRQAYRAHDMAALSVLAEDYARLPDLLERFIETFRTLWLKENKPHGLEVHEARLGGLLLRTRTCHERLRQYIAGTLPKIDELEEDLLLYGQSRLQMQLYRSIVSVSDL